MPLPTFDPLYRLADARPGGPRVRLGQLLRQPTRRRTSGILPRRSAQPETDGGLGRSDIHEAIM